ncbi:hypothetical protein ABWJ92_35620 [Streptomyces sp. NPDC000609]|uniref:hypothetical protein n=1 Tax=Streptomyces sp. NPDC000609 TaxID=3160957 RepID=UPI00339A993E
MLRVHFTDADLAAVHVALRPDPLWETVLGLQQLTHPGQGPVVFARGGGTLRQSCPSAI